MGGGGGRGERERKKQNNLRAKDTVTVVKNAYVLKVASTFIQKSTSTHRKLQQIHMHSHRTLSCTLFNSQILGTSDICAFTVVF